MRIAMTRAVSSSIAQCVLTHLQREPIDLARARQQHTSYEKLLSTLGCHILRLPEEPDLPDAVFIEDVAVVLDETAVITRPGAVSRRRERRSVSAALRPFRPLAEIHPPGTLDGGDVLRLGRRLWVGLSSRTNAEGFEQLRAMAAPLGYELAALPVRGCLHLKSAVTVLDEETFLLNRSWIDAVCLGNHRILEIDPSEPYAANALPVGNNLIFPVAFPCTRERLENAGYRIAAVDLGELAKAEGAVTCCSLLFEA